MDNPLVWTIFSVMGWAAIWALEMLEYVWRSLLQQAQLLHTSFVQRRGRPCASRFILSIPIRAESNRWWRSVVCQTTDTIRSCHIGIRMRFSAVKSRFDRFQRYWVTKILKNSGTGDSVASIHLLQVWIFLDTSLSEFEAQIWISERSSLQRSIL